MTLNYDHRNRKSPLKMTEERRKLSDLQTAFGCSTSRFGFGDLNPNPGVGSYELNASTLLRKSPSLSSKGFGNSFLSKSPKTAPFIDLGNPGPADYNLPSFGQSPTYKQRPSTSFIQSGDGKRVPFAPPNNFPGPSDYHINHFPGKSPLLTNKSSATFESVTDRNSIFDNVTASPPPGKYHIERADKIFKQPTGDISFAKSSREERFNHIGRDNQVPGPHTYFQTPLEHSPSGKSLRNNSSAGSPPQRNSVSPPRPLSRSDRSGQSLHGSLYEGSTAGSLVGGSTAGGAADDHSVRSLRSVGNYKGKLLGKQNERPAPIQTFGADKDRFKNSTFGRLDLIAEIPGPGAYNLGGDGMADNINRKIERVNTASAASSPLRLHRTDLGISPTKQTQRPHTQGSQRMSSARSSNGF